MIFCELEFLCRFATTGNLPTFQGSMLRGAFGRSLRNISCALRRQECKTCLLKPVCVYAFLFEGADSKHSGDETVVEHHDSVLPYVVEPPLGQARTYSPGDPLVFKILLFGRATGFVPHIVCAVERMGEMGLGRRGDALGKYALESVRMDGDSIYDQSTRKLEINRTPAELKISPPSSNGISDIRVDLVTPLRFKHQNRLWGEVPFHILMRAALRRITALEAAYGQGAPSFDFRGIVARASSVSVSSMDCRWVEHERYSSRQKTAMRFGGIAGQIVYTGNLSEFVPFLRYCERVHLGKQTTFGYGQVRISQKVVS